MKEVTYDETLYYPGEKRSIRREALTLAVEYGKEAYTEAETLAVAAKFAAFIENGTT